MLENIVECPAISWC